MKVAKGQLLQVSKLRLKQEKFCQLYASDKEFFGNGVLSYSEAYDIKIITKAHYNICAAGASENLRKTNIIERINELLDTQGFNDENVDKQHNFLLNQHVDLKTKMAAVKHYNELKKRVDSDKEKPGDTYNILVVNQDPKEMSEKFYKFLEGKTG